MVAHQGVEGQIANIYLAHNAIFRILNQPVRVHVLLAVAPFHCCAVVLSCCFAARDQQYEIDSEGMDLSKSGYDSLIDDPLFAPPLPGILSCAIDCLCH